MRSLFVTVALVLLIPAALLKPWIGILGWNWIGLMNPHRLTWGFVSTLPVAMLIGGATLLGLALTKERRKPAMTKAMVLLLVFCVHVTLTSAFAMVPDYAWYQWEQVMKIQLMTFVSTMLIFSAGKIRALLLVIAGSIGFFGAKGGFFSLTTGGVHQVRGPSGSFIESNNDLGLAMIMVIPVLLALAKEEEKPWVRLSMLIAAGLSFVATIFTYSRGALLGLAVASVLILLDSRRKVLALVLVAPLALGLASFAPDKLYRRAGTIETYDEDGSSMQRLQAWSVAFELAKTRPLTGGGFKIQYLPDGEWLSYAWRQFDKWGDIARSAHSVYFQILGEHGFLGLGIFLGIIASTLVSLQRTRVAALEGRAPAQFGNYARALQIGVAGYCSCGAFLSQAYFDLFWTYVALSAILAREVTDAVQSRDPAISTEPRPASRLTGSGIGT